MILKIWLACIFWTGLIIFQTFWNAESVDYSSVVKKIVLIESAFAVNRTEERKSFAVPNLQELEEKMKEVTEKMNSKIKEKMVEERVENIKNFSLDDASLIFERIDHLHQKIKTSSANIKTIDTKITSLNYVRIYLETQLAKKFKHFVLSDDEKYIFTRYHIWINTYGDKQVYYIQNTQMSEEITNEDISSFRLLSEDFWIYNNVIYGKWLADYKYDANTFEVLNYFYVKDKNGIYWVNIGGILLEIKWLDSETFEVLDYAYAKDKNSVYNYYKKLEWADLSTFEVINNTYLKDKNWVYFDGMILEGSDSNTFELLEKPYSKDQNYVYRHSELLEWRDPWTFQILNEIYTKDNNAAYHKDEKIQFSDSDSFEVIIDNYSKDKNNVYRFREKLLWRDPSTFEILDDWYSKDKKNVYYHDNKLEWSDPLTFEILKWPYFQDKNGIYSESQKLQWEELDKFYTKYPEYID